MTISLFPRHFALRNAEDVQGWEGRRWWEAHGGWRTGMAKPQDPALAGDTLLGAHGWGAAPLAFCLAMPIKIDTRHISQGLSSLFL